MTLMKTAAIVATIAATAIASPASAQRVVDTKGFYVGGGLNASSIKIDDSDIGDSDRESGGGFYFHAGWNFTPRLGAFIGGAAANISADDGNDFLLGHADLGGRLSFPGASSFLPYIEVAITAVSAEDEFEDQDVELSGTGATGAAGFNYFLSQKVALDLNVRYTVGEFNTVKIGDISISNDDGIGMNTARINLGLAYYPFAGQRSRVR